MPCANVKPCCGGCAHGKPCEGERVAGAPHGHGHHGGGGRGPGWGYGPVVIQTVDGDCGMCLDMIRRGYCGDTRVAGAAPIGRCRKHAGMWANGMLAQATRIAGDRVGEDLTGGFDTAQNRAIISASAKAGAAAIQVGQKPTYGNYKAMVTQGLMVAATFAPELAPFVGAMVALFFGFEQAMKAFPQAQGGGGAACPANDCHWCGNFNIAPNGQWPPKDETDSNWLRYGQTPVNVPGKVWGPTTYPNLPDDLDLNTFETFYVTTLKIAYEMYMNCKLPVISARALLVACVDTWNAVHQGSPLVYTSAISDKYNGWGWEPTDGAGFISEVISKTWNGVDVAPSPGSQTVLMGDPPKYLGSLHKALAGLTTQKPSQAMGSALGVLQVNQDAARQAAGLAPVLAQATKKLSPAAQAVREYVYRYTRKDWTP